MDLTEQGEFGPLSSFVSHFWGEDLPCHLSECQLFIRMRWEAHCIRKWSAYQDTKKALYRNPNPAHSCGFGQETLQFKEALLLHARKIYPADPGRKGPISLGSNIKRISPR